MEILSAAEFKCRIEKDPAWAGTITQHTTIKGKVVMHASDIRCLSPLLNFEDEVDLSFSSRLKVVSGTFAKTATFLGSAIQEIHPDLKVLYRSEKETGASFRKCPIQIARGKFLCPVSFSFCDKLTAVESSFEAPGGYFNGSFGIKTAPIEIIQNPVDFVFERGVVQQILAEYSARTALKRKPISIE